jgi:hypothetical protein
MRFTTSGKLGIELLAERKNWTWQKMLIVRRWGSISMFRQLHPKQLLGTERCAVVITTNLLMSLEILGMGGGYRGRLRLYRRSSQPYPSLVVGVYSTRSRVLGRGQTGEKSGEGNPDGYGRDCFSSK